MNPRKDSADRGAGSGCMARLVRCSSFLVRGQVGVEGEVNAIYGSSMIDPHHRLDSKADEFMAGVFCRECLKGVKELRRNLHRKTIVILREFMKDLRAYLIEKRAKPALQRYWCKLRDSGLCGYQASLCCLLGFFLSFGLCYADQITNDVHQDPTTRDGATDTVELPQEKGVGKSARSDEAAPPSGDGLQTGQSVDLHLLLMCALGSWLGMTLIYQVGDLVTTRMARKVSSTND